jgi:hypothetical protein
MVDIPSDLGHGRSAGASAQVDAILAVFPFVVFAAVQRKAPHPLQTRFPVEAAQGNSKSQAPGVNESPGLSGQGTAARSLGGAR